RCKSASIIEFSKCVRRHHVTSESGFPLQPLRFRNGVTASVRPFCISTTVPYWSNMQTLICDLSASLTLVIAANAHPHDPGDETDHPGPERQEHQHPGIDVSPIEYLFSPDFVCFS